MLDIDLNELFKLTYTFDNLKQAIETLANNMDSKDKKMNDFMGDMRNAIIKQGKGIRTNCKHDVDALRDEMMAKIGDLEKKLGDRKEGDVTIKTENPAFDPSGLEAIIDELRKQM